MAPHSSTLVWKIPWMEEPDGLQSMGSLRVDRTEGLHFHFSLSCTGEGNGNPLQCSCLENPREGGSLVGCRLWGCTESDTTEETQQQQQQQQCSNQTLLSQVGAGLLQKFAEPILGAVTLKLKCALKATEGILRQIWEYYFWSFDCIGMGKGLRTYLFSKFPGDTFVQFSSVAQSCQTL